MSDDSDDVKEVGEYTLGKTLGQGSFGKVKLAKHKTTGVEIAVKIVQKDSISDVEDVERVYRETFILTSLKHKNIIKLHEVFDTPKSILLAMEYADGGELLDYVTERQRLTEVESCRFFHQIVSGVEYCHRAKVLQRARSREGALKSARVALPRRARTLARTPLASRRSSIAI